MIELAALGVTPAKERQFESKGIMDVKGLLDYLPYRYKDCSHVTGFLNKTEISCVVLKLLRVSAKITTTGKKMTTATCFEPLSQTYVNVMWFNMPWLYNKIENLVGFRVFVAGHADYNDTYHNYSIVNPDIFEEDIPQNRKIIPVYSAIRGMSANYLIEKEEKALSHYAAKEEICPKEIIAELGLPSMQKTYQELHSPNSMSEVEDGKRRILFNDLLYFALHNELSREEVNDKTSIVPHDRTLVDKIIKELPYELTEDQKTAVKDLVDKASSGSRINALVQGDVGCGKTIVAMLLAALFIGSGYQCAIMAPTQVLSTQHYTDAVQLFEPFGVEVAFFGTSKIPTKEKRARLSDVASGKAKLIIGTTAVISPAVEYNNLGLTIVDEEHKFGVIQRAAIAKKAEHGVHSVTMSATPIPRSLAQVIYGDHLQLCTITTMPAGRKPVITGICRDRERVYNFIASQCRKGRQAYVVCPKIDTDDSEEMHSVEQTLAEYESALNRYGLNVASLTGRNSKDETAAIIESFKAGSIDVLVSTTVIEVGVNVPNASVMCITDADRFGLSQMHQLRGRVGRGSYQSYCLLESGKEDSKAMERMQAMCDTTNGFEIAEADLRIRGAGDFLGTKQSGENKYVSLVMAYPDKYAITKRIARELLESKSKCTLVQRVLVEHDKDMDK